jgi:hypothetical protein
MNLYYYIIWNHGIKYIQNILSLIRDTDNIKINKIIKINPDFKTFLFEVYKFDRHVSKEHIIKKNKFLLQNNSESFLILVENNKPNIKETNSGKIYCEIIDNLKWKIREQFNPRYENKDFNPYPGANQLSNGIKHEHVIHSCDKSIETFYILKILNLNKLSYYIGNPCKDPNYLVPSRLKPNFNFKIINIDINKLKCTLVDNQIYNLEQTPHFKYLNNDKTVYQKYILDNLGVSLKDDHLPEAYDKLINNFDYNKLINNKKSLIICYDNFIIKDGLHRACILKHKNIKQIDVIVLVDY